MYYQVTGDMVGGGTTIINTTITGLKGNALPDLSTGTLKWNGSAWVFDNSSYSPLYKNDIIDGTISITGTDTATIGRHHVCSGTSGNYTLTLPNITGNAGRCVSIAMSSELTKLVSVVSPDSNIDGQTTRIMWANETCVLRAKDDESGWVKIAGKTIPMVAQIAKTNGGQLIPASTLTKLSLNAVISPAETPYGMVDIDNNRIVIVRPGKYSMLGYCMLSGNSSSNSISVLSMHINGNINSSMKNASFLQEHNISMDTHNETTLTLNSYIELYLWVGIIFTTSTIFDNTHIPKLSVVETPTW